MVRRSTPLYGPRSPPTPMSPHMAPQLWPRVYPTATAARYRLLRPPRPMVAATGALRRYCTGVHGMQVGNQLGTSNRLRVLTRRVPPRDAHQTEIGHPQSQPMGSPYMLASAVLTAECCMGMSNLSISATRTAKSRGGTIGWGSGWHVPCPEPGPTPT